MAAKKKKASKKSAAKAAKKAAPKKSAAAATEPEDAAEPAPAEAAKPAAAPKKKAAAKKAAAKKAPVEVEEIVREPKRIPKMPARKKGVITLGLGIEADAAFMIYALEHGKIDIADRKYELVRKEQSELDELAPKSKLDVTLLSLGAYPQVDDRYMILPCGGSFGDHRGPILVARSPIRANEVEGLAVATPGRFSTAAIALRLWLPRGRFDFQPMSARAVSLVVRADHARSGLLTTEDQLAYKQHHLIPVVDLGQWWGDDTEGLPLPLTVAGIRRDIAEDERAAISLDLKRSIAYALGHREEALEFANQFSRKASPEQIDNFIDRYVNDLSLDCGERGRQAIGLLFDRARRIGIYKDEVWPEYHGVE